MEGLGRLMQTIEMIRANLNPRLMVDGILLTMYDARQNLSDQVALDLRARYEYIVSSLWPTLLVRLEQVSPISYLTFGGGLRFSF